MFKIDIVPRFTIGCIVLANADYEGIIARGQKFQVRGIRYEEHCNQHQIGIQLNGDEAWVFESCFEVYTESPRRESERMELLLERISIAEDRAKNATEYARSMSKTVLEYGSHISEIFRYLSRIAVEECKAEGDSRNPHPHGPGSSGKEKYDEAMIMQSVARALKPEHQEGFPTEFAKQVAELIDDDSNEPITEEWLRQLELMNVFERIKLFFDAEVWTDKKSFPKIGFETRKDIRCWAHLMRAELKEPKCQNEQ